jgi:hypothetical protein
VEAITVRVGIEWIGEAILIRIFPPFLAVSDAVVVRVGVQGITREV